MSEKLCPVNQTISGLREAIESGRYRTPLAPETQRALLQRLTEVESLERFLHKAYLGQKRFSIEGVDMMVPMLDLAIEMAADTGAAEVVLGMAHRGRLNVLAHTLGRPYVTLFSEFEGLHHPETGDEFGTGWVCRSSAASRPAGRSSPRSTSRPATRSTRTCSARARTTSCASAA